MLPNPKEYINSICELKSMGNSPILLGVLSDITDDGVKISRKEDRLPLIHCNSTVKVNVYNSDLGFRVIIGKVYLSTAEFIRLTDVQNASDYEKRGFYRVKINMETEARLVTQKPKGGEQQSKPFRVQVLDLSLSGLFFVSGRSMQIGDRVAVTLSLYGQSVPMLCTIHRTRPVEMGTEDGYGCSFEDNSGKKFDLLCKLLFQYQREQIHHMREKQET